MQSLERVLRGGDEVGGFGRLIGRALVMLLRGSVAS